MCGGSGGDGGAAERKSQEEGRQSQAIARLNRAFGIASDAPGAAPERSAFRKLPAHFADASEVPRSGGSLSGEEQWGGGSWGAQQASARPPVDDGLDDAAYQTALQQWQQEQQENAGAPGTRQARERLYGQVAADSKALQLDDLGKDRKLVQRDVDFDLARRGLFGGSRQVDAGRDIEDQYNRGVMTADNNAQTVANQARMADEKTRVALINSIRSGMGEADATSAAFNALQNNAAEAANAARSQSVGGFFDAIRGAANQYQQADAYERAFQKYRTGGTGGGGSYGGSVRSVE